MARNTTESTSADKNKENVTVGQSSSVLRNANGRRSRSRPRPNNVPPPVVITREAARDPVRRHTQSPAPVTPTLALRPSIDFEVAETASSTDTAATQNKLSLPRRLKRPPFCEIAPAAIENVDPDLKGVAMEYIHQNLQRVGRQYVSILTLNLLSHTDRPIQDVRRRY